MGVLGQSRDTGAAGVIAPLQGPVDRTGFFSNIGPGFRQAVAGSHSTRVGEAIYEQKLYDDVVNALSAEGEQGEDTLTITTTPTRVKRKFRNPYVSGPGQNLLNPTYNPLTSLYGGGDRREIDQIWGAVKRVRQRKPDFLKAFPDEGSLKAFALQRRQKEIAASQAVTERASTAGSVGGFIGAMGGSLASMDPENVVGGGFGTAAGKTFARAVVKRAVESAGANAAAAMVGVPGMEEDARRLGQEMTTEDAVHQVGVAAGLGAAFGVAHVAVPKAAEGAKAVVGKVAENLPAPVRDALVAASIRAGTVQDRSLLGEWIRMHNPGGIIDTATPDERAAAHTVTRDIENREASPLKPEDAHHNEARLGAIAHSLGVNLSTLEIPTPIQQPTVRDRSGGRRTASYEEAVHTAEGTGKNPDSSADGHFQFTAGTWLEYAPRIVDTKGMSRQQILALRHDRPTAERAERLFRSDNARYFRERGIEDSPGNLSLAHFLGRSDAAKVLNADPSTPVERLVDPASLRANRKVLAGKSASKVVAWAHRRIGARVDLPVARADAVPDADPLDGADYSDTPYEMVAFKPDELPIAEPATHIEGEQWNPIQSGELLLWERENGERVIVDGNKRAAMAQRLYAGDPSIRLSAAILREADGISEQIAQAVGMLKNVNLGKGSLEERAAAIADMPEVADLLRAPEHQRAVAAIAQLPYEDFGAVLNGETDPMLAAQRYTYSREISPELDKAQRAYIAKTNQRISQTELQRLSWALQDGMKPDEAAASVHEFFSRPIDWDAEREVFAAELKARKGKPNAEPQLQPVGGGAEEDRFASEPSGEAGGRDAAAASDILLSERDEPSLFDQAVAARAEAEPFSDPVGEAAKAQTEILGHDLRMAEGPAGKLEEFMAEGNERFLIYTAPDGSVSNIQIILGKDGTAEISIDPFLKDSNRLGPSAIRGASRLLSEMYPEIKSLFGERLSGAKPGRVQKVELPKAPIRTVENQEPAPPSLFGLPETGYRLSEEGGAQPIQTIMQEAEADEIAAKNAADCLKPPTVAE